MRHGNFIDVQLQHAQILALHTTPIEVIRNVPSEVVSIWKVDGVVDTSDGAYTEAGTLRLRYGRATGVGAVDREAFADMDEFSAGLLLEGIRSISGACQPYRPSVDLVGQPVTIVNAADAFLGGDPSNTLSLRIWYTTFPGAPFKP